jgi:hypothetical protein
VKAKTKLKMCIFLKKCYFISRKICSFGVLVLHALKEKSGIVVDFGISFDTEEEIDSFQKYAKQK